MANFLKNQPDPSMGGGIFKLPHDKEERVADTAPAEAPDKRPNQPAQDLNRYHDPEGLSLGTLNLGYWLIKNRFVFYRGLVIILIVISTFTWARFVYTFGSYLIFGIRADNDMLAQMAQDTVRPDILASQAPVSLKVGQLMAVRNEKGTYDFAVEVENANRDHYAQATLGVSYNGKLLKSGPVLVFPGERKHFILLDVESPAAAGWKLQVLGEGWARIDKHVYRDWTDFYQERSAFQVDNKTFESGQRGLLSEKLVLNSLEFDISNNTAYNYWRVQLGIVLRNGSQLLGANIYNLDEFRSGHTEHINITWPGSLSTIKDIIIEPTVNYVDNAAYMEFSGEAVDL